MSETLILGDCVEKMKEMPENSIDTIITDPPYGLEFMGKEWDKLDNKAHTILKRRREIGNPDYKSVAAFLTHSVEYVGGKAAQEWHYRWAKEALRVAKPGATMLVFGGTRTFHRLTCAVEDAGWIIKDCLMFLHGMGFPKGTDISKMIDKKLGLANERGYIEPTGGLHRGTGNTVGKFTGKQLSSKSISPDAELWEGYKSHALKPAWEPIILAMKPNDGSYSENALKWGVAGLNIDLTRIEMNNQDKTILYQKASKNPTGVKSAFGGGIASEPHPQGRFPANVILECICDKVIEGKDEIVSVHDAPKGTFAGGKQGRDSIKNYRERSVGKSIIHTNPECPCYMVDQQQESASRFFYVAKASKSERNLGCERLEQRQAGSMVGSYNGSLTGKIVYNRNFHPTVKPLKLMVYLCNLTKTPKGGVVLDPFMGSGTTGIACRKTGRDFIGIEQSEEYVKIATLRLEHWKEELKTLFDEI